MGVQCVRGSPGPPGSGARRSPPCLSLSQIGAPKLSLSCLQTPARAAIRLRAFRLLVFHFSLPPSFSNRNPCLRGRKARADSGRRRRLRWRWGGGGSAATFSRGSSPGHVSAADGDSTLTRDRESIRGEMAPLGSLRGSSRVAPTPAPREPGVEVTRTRRPARRKWRGLVSRGHSPESVRTLRRLFSLFFLA